MPLSTPKRELGPSARWGGAAGGLTYSLILSRGESSGGQALKSEVLAAPG